VKLYLVTRTDEWDCDEYDAVLVRHNSAEEARQYVVTASSDGRKNYLGLHEGNTAVSEVTADGEPGEVISSFRAG
jgi:hypothetical protein